MADNRPVIANLDFDDIKSDLVRYFKNRPEFADYEFTGSSLNLLMDVLAYNTHYNNLTANFLVNEMFLDSALLRKNVVSIARMLNYTPRSATASSASIKVAVQKASSNFVTIPAFSTFTASSGTTTFRFFPLDSHTLQFDDTDPVGTERDIEFDVYEGTPITQRFVVDNVREEFPVFEINNTNVDTSTLTVLVNPQEDTFTTGTSSTYSNAVKYTQVSPNEQGITSLNDESTIYFLEEVDDGKYRIRFGNGTIGKKLNVGEEILVSYLVTSGSVANGVAPTTGDFTISSSTIASGGSEPESIREIKDNAPNWFQSQFRAVTEKDYETILKQNYSDIQTINVYGGEKVGKPGKVFFSIKPKNADKLTEQAKLTITRDILSKFNLVTVRPEIVDPNIIRVIAKTVIQYDPSNLNGTPENLVAQVNALYNTLNTAYIGDFLKSFQVSRLITEILNLDTAIVSANPRINLRFDVVAKNGSLDVPEFSYGNRLHEIAYSGSPILGAVFSSTLFKRSGRVNNSQILDDGRGTLVLVDIIENEKIIVNSSAGSINYLTGEVEISDFDPADGKIGLIAIPESFDVEAKDNYLLQMSVGDSTVRAISQDDKQALATYNVSRAK
jgi:hypothetical protein